MLLDFIIPRGWATKHIDLLTPKLPPGNQEPTGNIPNIPWDLFNNKTRSGGGRVCSPNDIGCEQKRSAYP